MKTNFWSTWLALSSLECQKLLQLCKNSEKQKTENNKLLCRVWEQKQDEEKMIKKNVRLFACACGWKDDKI